MGIYSSTRIIVISFCVLCGAFDVLLLIWLILNVKIYKQRKSETPTTVPLLLGYRQTSSEPSISFLPPLRYAGIPTASTRAGTQLKKVFSIFNIYVQNNYIHTYILTYIHSTYIVCNNNNKVNFFNVT